MIKIKIAELIIGIDNRFDHIVHLSGDYLCDGEPAFTVSATDDELVKEAGHQDTECSSGYLESIVVYRKIAEQLPHYDAFVFHGAIISYDGHGFVFTARSGVGKTTHTRLWMSEFGDKASYVNGDKPIVRFKDGVPYAYGTPWRGKEGYGANTSVPLEGVAIIERGSENIAYVIDKKDCAVKIMTQTYIPKSPVAAALTMKLLDRLLSSVKLVRLECNMDPEASHIAKRILLGE